MLMNGAHRSQLGSRDARPGTSQGRLAPEREGDAIVLMTPLLVVVLGLSITARVLSNRQQLRAR